MVSPIVPAYDYATDRYLILGAWVDTVAIHANPRHWRWLVVMHLWAAFPWLWAVHEKAKVRNAENVVVRVNAAPGEGETR